MTAPHSPAGSPSPVETGVQDAVEKAILSVDGGLRRLSVAGRTDTGVHATGQVAHVDLEKDWRPFRLKEALNAWLRDLGTGGGA
jgi:tRNA pseudouridine(38-40) synthase